VLHGYVPSDSSCGASVSRTLNYLHGDWALSQACQVVSATAAAATAAAAAAKGKHHASGVMVDLTQALEGTPTYNKTHDLSLLRGFSPSTSSSSSSLSSRRSLIGLGSSVFSVDEAAQVLADRAANWTKLVNPALQGFLTPKNSAGEFDGNFDQFAWGESMKHIDNLHGVKL
jgi:hypothetical protein